MDRAGEPRALRYLIDLGVDPARDVRLVVATHWHDDHIRSMAQLVATCSQATFCCASVLCKEEFLTLVGTLEHGRFSGTSSGVRELYRVLTMLNERATQPTFAIANRRLYFQGPCEIWSLSPHDREFVSFLNQLGSDLPRQGQARRRLPSLTPNQVAVVLWVQIGDAVLLLGSDLEKPGWVQILHSPAGPNDKASVFKVPHHGSANADEPNVWQHLLETHP